MARKRGQIGVAANEPANAGSGNDTASSLRVIGLVATAIGLLALTALACVESYPSMHALAGQAAVSPALAKYYPLIFDAMLLIAGPSVLALRGAGLPSRIYAWLSLLVVLAALAAGSVVHAANLSVPRRSAAIAAAAIPWALVLIAFGLLLALLSYAKRRRSASRAATVAGQLALPPGQASDDLGESVADGPDGATEPAAVTQAQPARPLARPADLQLRARVPATRIPLASETAHEATLPTDATAPSAATTTPNRRPQVQAESPGQAAQATAGLADLVDDTAEVAGAAEPADSPAEPPELRREHGSPTPPES